MMMTATVAMNMATARLLPSTSARQRSAAASRSAGSGCGIGSCRYGRRSGSDVDASMAMDSMDSGAAGFAAPNSGNIDLDSDPDL